MDFSLRKSFYVTSVDAPLISLTVQISVSHSHCHRNVAPYLLSPTWISTRAPSFRTWNCHVADVAVSMVCIHHHSLLQSVNLLCTVGHPVAPVAADARVKRGFICHPPLLPLTCVSIWLCVHKSHRTNLYQFLSLLFCVY